MKYVAVADCENMLPSSTRIDMMYAQCRSMAEEHETAIVQILDKKRVLTLHFDGTSFTEGPNLSGDTYQSVVRAMNAALEQLRSQGLKQTAVVRVMYDNIIRDALNAVAWGPNNAVSALRELVQQPEAYYRVIVLWAADDKSRPHLVYRDYRLFLDPTFPVPSVSEAEVDAAVPKMIAKLIPSSLKIDLHDRAMHWDGYSEDKRKVRPATWPFTDAHDALIQSDR